MSIKRHLTRPATMIIVLVAMTLLSGCNSSSEEIDDSQYQRNTQLIVTKFSLKADRRVMAGLDSVYFAIDLKQGIIYNADSLPVGTPINKLIPLISYPGTVEGMRIIQQGDSVGDRVETDYMENPNDTIDFSKKVTLEMATDNGNIMRTYQLKVNVHKMNPDSLDFDVEARMALPSRLPQPLRQRTVSRDGKVYMMLEENDGSRTMAITTDMARGEWEKHPVATASGLRVETLAATTDAFYMLDGSGTLHASTDGLTWNAVSSVPAWTAIIGGYGNSLQGIRHTENGYVHTQYPMGSFTETALEPTFPTSGYSNMNLYTTKWSSLPLGLISGGRYDDGLCGGTWAFDGNTWLNITDKGMPGVYGGVMFPYYAYLRTSTLWLFNEYSIWLYIGGRLADGTPNKNVYLSYDNGVHWSLAPKYMQLPEAINSYMDIGCAVMDTPLEANFSPSAWRSVNGKRNAANMRKLPYVINGYQIEWNCPYIYLVGGYTESDATHVSPWIYRGVINRMRFKPLI